MESLIVDFVQFSSAIAIARSAIAKFLFLEQRVGTIAKSELDFKTWLKFAHFLRSCVSRRSAIREVNTRFLQPSC